MNEILAGITIGIHLASAHVPALDGQQAANPGLYFRTATGWGGGFYRNTLDRMSVWGGYTFERDHGPHNFGLTAGFVTGYKQIVTETPGTCHNPPPLPPSSYACTIVERKGYNRSNIGLLVAPSYAFRLGPVTPRITYLPKWFTARDADVFHLSIEKKW